jgi:uncharacterized membrane-anchored protein
MKRILGTSALALAAALALGMPVALSAKDEPKPAASERAPAVPPALIALQKSLHPQTGDVRIPQAKAVLHLGDNYYFLPAEEAKRVLSEGWGNPPEQGVGVLGMVMEKGSTLYDAVWGAVITFDASGHVSDKDAAAQDYNKVLSDMQSGEVENNQKRKAEGYPAMNLVGWAQPPSYDQANHSLIWARDYTIEGQADHSLNYDVRLLGREGVLSLNMLSTMSTLGDVRSAAQAFGKSVTFEPGGAYTDYNSSTDKTAEYGLAGLVAGGAAVAVASKLGLFGVLAAFGKWIFIGIAAVGASVVGFFRKMFGRNRDKDLI